MDNFERAGLIEKRDSLQRRLRDYQKTLLLLQEKEAKYGLDVPVHILRGIEEFGEKIERAELELAAVQAQLKQLPAQQETAAKTAPISAPLAVGPEPEPAAPVDLEGMIAEPDLAQLRQAAADGSLLLFVGAGFSTLAGLPNWYALMAELAAQVGHALPPAQWATGDALVDAAQAYINRRGLNDLLRFLMDRLRTTPAMLTAAHRALARLPVSLVFTANYDTLLEDAFNRAGKRANTVTRDDYIPFMRAGPGEVNIVKLYGDLQQPETIVLARQQFESYFLEHPQMVKLLETEVARSTALYIGWSHTDPHFGLIFGELLSRFGQFARSGYALMVDAPDTQRRELERKKIRLLPLPPGPAQAAQLAALFNLLHPERGG